MSCQTPGNIDMYGLGIRVGFYLQWLGQIAAEAIDSPESLPLRYTNTFFIAAEFLALLVQVSYERLRSVDIYIVLLLTYGGYFYLVPLYIWRLLVRCRTRWDPSSWVNNNARPGRIFSALTFGLLFIVSGFQMWFWTTGIAVVSGLPPGCLSFGFLFAQVPLESTGFKAVNIILNVCLLLTTFFFLCALAGVVDIEPGEEEKPRPERQAVLRRVNYFIRLAVASIIVAASELTIQWNDLTDVNDVSTAGQTIPLVIGIAACVRVVYKALRNERAEEDDDDSSHGRRYDGRRGPALPPWAIPLAAPMPTSSRTSSRSDRRGLPDSEPLDLRDVPMVVRPVQPSPPRPSHRYDRRAPQDTEPLDMLAVPERAPNPRWRQSRERSSSRSRPRDTEPMERTAVPKERRETRSRRPPRHIGGSRRHQRE